MKAARLLTVWELSGALHLHPQTIYLWKREAKLPFVEIEGRVRFDAEEVERFIKARKSQPPPLPPPPQVDFPLSEYDRFYLKGGRRALSKDSRRWNYSIGSISVRKTKKGHDRWYLDYRSKEGERRREVARYARTRAEAVAALQSRVSQEFNREFGIENPAQFAGALLFEEFADRYLHDYAEKTKRSADTDKYRLRSIREAFGAFKLSDITKTMILEFR